MEIYERIRELRRELKMSQSDFGLRLGVNRDVINNIENNRLARPDQKLSLVKLMCKEFGVNEQWLLTGEGEPFPKKTRKEEIAEFIGSLSDDDTFKTNLIAVLAKLSPEKWKVLEEVAQKIVAPSQFEEGDSAQDTASGVAAAEAEYIKNVSENARRQGAPASSSTEEGSEGETA